MVDTQWLVGRAWNLCLHGERGEERERERENVVQNVKNKRGQLGTALDFDIQVLLFKDYVMCSCLGRISNFIGHMLTDDKSV